MKRILWTAFVTALLSCILCAGASAKYEAIAEELAAVGMFRGTANGYELDRAPTRAEATIMLVRLYGAEEETAAAYAAGEIACPFSDVSAYASPYVAWLYAKGVVKGVTETSFGSQRACGLANYTAFLLRALGYQDGVDFRYADALSFAEAHGLKTSDIAGETFTRDNLVLMTCRGLGAKLKGEQDPHGKILSMKLLEEGRLDGQKAAALQRYVDASLNGKDEIPSYALPREQSAMTRWKAVVSGSSISYVCREPDAVKAYDALPDYRVTSLPDGFALSGLRTNGFLSANPDNTSVEWTYQKKGARLTFQCLRPLKTLRFTAMPYKTGGLRMCKAFRRSFTQGNGLFRPRETLIITRTITTETLTVCCSGRMRKGICSFCAETTWRRKRCWKRRGASGVTTASRSTSKRAGRPRAISNRRAFPPPGVFKRTGCAKMTA